MNQKNNNKPILIVTKNDEGQRVDNFLFKKRKQLDKKTCYKFMRKGQIRINGKRIKPTQKIVAGDEVRMPPFVFFVDEPELKVSKHIQENLMQTILFEDDDYLVFNKPAGLPVHKGTGFDVGVSEIVRSFDTYQNVQLAHRLDKDTSGCLLFSKNRPALLHFQSALKQHEVQKTYLTVLTGLLEKSEKVEQALDTSNRVNGIRTVVVSSEGQSAQTVFKPMKHKNNLTLCQCQISHGRTHQIRVHASHIGHPVLGDPIYGTANKQLNRVLYLHASELRFSNHHFVANMPLGFSELFD